MQRFAMETASGYLPVLFGAGRVIALMAAGLILMVVIDRLIRTIRTYSVGVMTRRGDRLPVEIEKRAATVATVARRALLTLLWATLATMSLKELGFQIDALLAGLGISAGIIGVALGFGAQSLVKDIIAGLFLLIENQIRVNDVAIINGIGGAVEQINLRTTVLRSENGAVHIIPNGSIQTLANLTHGFAFYVFEIAMSYEQDYGRAVAILEKIASDMRSEVLWRDVILDNLEVIGIDRLTTTGIVFKARIKTIPMKQWLVGREMNQRIRTQYLAAGLDLTPSATVVRVETATR